MKFDYIEELARHKMKMHQMKIDKIRETVAHQKKDKQEKKQNKVSLETERHDPRYYWR